ncbi:MAG TPA: hypothetical protein VFE05_11215 [Longimicrobiaceae bacterium]|jgi:hypothetical protein|nr:hypothetical protein [Longimicrobiaceae bacterium]
MIPRLRTAFALLSLLLLPVSAAAGQWAECAVMREMQGPPPPPTIGAEMPGAMRRFHAHALEMRLAGDDAGMPMHRCPPPRMPECPMAGGPGGWLAALASPPTTPAAPPVASAAPGFAVPGEAPDLLLARGPFHPPRA